MLTRNELRKIMLAKRINPYTGKKLASNGGKVIRVPASVGKKYFEKSFSECLTA